MGNGIRKVKTSDLELKDRLVSIQRVTKVTKGGRTFSFSAIVVVGNEDGIVGHGLGKASEVTTAIAKGIEDAKKNLIKVPVIHGTIPHEQVAKFGGAKVLIKPASEGTGVKGLFKPSQPGKGYIRCSPRNERRIHSCRTQGSRNGKSF